MPDNKYTGEVDITLGGTTYTMLIDWAAIARVQEATGNVDALRQIYKVGISTIAQIIAAILVGKYPDVTPETIIAASPPLNPTLALLDKAITYGYLGADEPKPAADAGESKKKTK